MIIVGGATATGKSAFAEFIAKSKGGELVSADSMQVYRGMDIGTAKDLSPAVRLHMVNVASPKEPFSVVDYKNLATEAIEHISARGKEAVVVGGTGFYIDSLLYSMDYGGSGEKNEQLMSELKNELSVKGAKHMYARLQEIDPLTAEKVHFNNTVRVLRALYVYLSTGRRISEQHSAFKPVEPVKMFVLTEERPVLREKIALRVDGMLRSGLENEVRGLLESGVDFDMQSMQGIGYKEWRRYFEYGDSKDSVREAVIKNTNAYAKRQETWFNNRYKNFAVKIPCALIKNDIGAAFNIVEFTEYRI